MSDPWTTIGSLVGGGSVVLALACTILVYVAKGAVAAAVAQAGALEIERVKNALETQLEHFKVHSMLEAEVRRQVAAKKVEMALKIAGAANAILETLYVKTDLSPLDLSAHQRVIDDFWSLFREAPVLLDKATIVDLEVFGREVSEAAGHVMVERMGGPRVDRDKRRQNADEVRSRLIDGLRRELQLETKGAVGNRATEQTTAR
jgi:hypothetical protein